MGDDEDRPMSEDAHGTGYDLMGNAVQEKAHTDVFGKQEPAGDPDFDPEEREHLAKVQLEQEERMRHLAEKQSEELREKNER